MSEQKLTLNITYYPAFENVRTIMEELHILLTPDKEQEKVHLNVLIILFWNGKILKRFLVRVTLPKINESESCKKSVCGKNLFSL